MIKILTLNKKGITDFSKERNKLLNNEKGKWVMFIDADEKITKELEDEIEQIDFEDTQYKGFYIKRMIVFIGKIIGFDKVLRIGNSKFGKWKRAIHETWNITGKTKTLNSYVIHETAGSLSQYIEKINKYSSLHAIENKKEGKRSSVVKIVFYPLLKFLYEYIILRRGFVFSFMQSLHSFLSWTSLYLYH